MTDLKQIDLLIDALETVQPSMKDETYKRAVMRMAIEAWNTRAAPDLLEALCKLYEATSDEITSQAGILRILEARKTARAAIFERMKKAPPETET